jgi:hypothetical protein
MSAKRRRRSLQVTFVRTNERRLVLLMCAQFDGTVSGKTVLRGGPL